MAEERLSRGEQTRSKIIHAAHDLFVQQGYHGTSMRQIAKEAEIALGGLYNHFVSKEEVFKAVFLEYHPYREVLPRILDAQGETVEEFVRDAFARILKAVENRPDFMNLMFIEVVEFNSLHAHELFTTNLPRIMPAVHRLLQTDQGESRPIPELIFVRTFFGLIFGYFVTDIILGSQAPNGFRENAEKYFVDIYLNGILT
jgi:AcrR family transcriptional regulator